MFRFVEAPAPEEGVAEIGEELRPARVVPDIRARARDRSVTPAETSPRAEAVQPAAARWSAARRASSAPRSPGGPSSERLRCACSRCQPTISAYSARRSLGGALEPVGEARVQVRPGLLRERVVGGIADQEMAELECLRVHEVGSTRPDELLADELVEHGWNAA